MGTGLTLSDARGAWWFAPSGYAQVALTCSAHPTSFGLRAAGGYRGTCPAVIPLSIHRRARPMARHAAACGTLGGGLFGFILAC